jgi:hypothetical protein
MGPMSTAERQKRYRERALRDPDGTLLSRLQVMLSPNAAANWTGSPPGPGRPSAKW